MTTVPLFRTEGRGEGETLLAATALRNAAFSHNLLCSEQMSERGKEKERKSERERGGETREGERAKE